MALPVPTGGPQLPAVPAGTFNAPNMGIGEIPQIFSAAEYGQLKGYEDRQAFEEKKRKLDLDEEYRRSLIAQREEATARRLQQHREWFFDHHQGRVDQAWKDVVATAHDQDTAPEAIWSALNSYHQTIQNGWSQAVAEGFVPDIETAKTLMPFQGVSLQDAQDMVAWKRRMAEAKRLQEIRKISDGGKQELVYAYEHFGSNPEKWPAHYKAIWETYGKVPKDQTISEREHALNMIRDDRLSDPEYNKKWNAMKPEEQEAEIQKKMLMITGPKPEEAPTGPPPKRMDTVGSPRVVTPEGQAVTAASQPIGQQWLTPKGIPLAEVRYGPGGQKYWYSLIKGKSIEKLSPGAKEEEEAPAKPAAAQPAKQQELRQGPGLGPGYEQAPAAKTAPNPYLTNP